ncbi:hypothetical protein LXL04_015923 [Taraxacum kok-saghyz]
METPSFAGTMVIIFLFFHSPNLFRSHLFQELFPPVKKTKLLPIPFSFYLASKPNQKPPDFDFYCLSLPLLNCVSVYNHAYAFPKLVAIPDMYSDVGCAGRNRVCSGPGSYPHTPHQNTKLTFIETTGSYLNLEIGFNSIARSYDLL